MKAFFSFGVDIAYVLLRMDSVTSSRVVKPFKGTKSCIGDWLRVES